MKMNTVKNEDVPTNMTQAQGAAYWNTHTLELESWTAAEFTPLASHIQSAARKAREAQQEKTSSSAKSKTRAA